MPVLTEETYADTVRTDSILERRDNYSFDNAKSHLHEPISSKTDSGIRLPYSNHPGVNACAQKKIHSRGGM